MFFISDSGDSPRNPFDTRELKSFDVIWSEYITVTSLFGDEDGMFTVGMKESDDYESSREAYDEMVLIDVIIASVLMI
jgi:hypothetical protein